MLLRYIGRDKGDTSLILTGMKQLQVGHMVAKDPADAIAQWFNAGGMVQYYDYPLEVLLNVSFSASIPAGN